MSFSRGFRGARFGAYWRRPHAYLDPIVRGAISGLALLACSVVATAMERLESDLASGNWLARYSKLMAIEDLDLGYRLVVAGDDTKEASDA